MEVFFFIIFFLENEIVGTKVECKFFIIIIIIIIYLEIVGTKVG